MRLKQRLKQEYSASNSRLTPAKEAQKAAERAKFAEEFSKDLAPIGFHFNWEVGTFCVHCNQVHLLHTLPLS